MLSHASVARRRLGRLAVLGRGEQLRVLGGLPCGLHRAATILPLNHALKAGPHDAGGAGVVVAERLLCRGLLGHQELAVAVPLHEEAGRGGLLEEAGSRRAQGAGGARLHVARGREVPLQGQGVGGGVEPRQEKLALRRPPQDEAGLRQLPLADAMGPRDALEVLPEQSRAPPRARSVAPVGLASVNLRLGEGDGRDRHELFAHVPWRGAGEVVRPPGAAHHLPHDRGTQRPDVAAEGGCRAERTLRLWSTGAPDFASP
mmetsp:Transcript_88782/g.248460  ORF Transcript_88782/g.248460 Transcript_88782/m.248460 type:complete len:259 (+) Transcript_88782:425-1201(+)